MLERIGKQTNGAGLVVAIIAVVLAVGGVAYAKGGGALTAKQKKEVEKIAKKFQGTGPKGDAGANGKDGANGTNGAPGTAGNAGEDGTDGVDGESVKLTQLAAGAQLQCEETGGALLEDEKEPTPTEVEVCNGEEGPQGPEGTWSVGTVCPPPSAAGEVGCLPVGQTETGAWGFVAGESDSLEIRVALSFPIKLAAPAPNPTRVHYETDPNFTDFDEAAGPEVIGCEGSPAIPKAPSGHLCVYGNSNLTNAKYLNITNLAAGNKGANRTGALVLFEREPTGTASGGGSFAVTG